MPVRTHGGIVFCFEHLVNIYNRLTFETLRKFVSRRKAFAGAGPKEFDNAGKPLHHVSARLNGTTLRKFRCLGGIPVCNNLTVDLGIILEDNGLHQLEIDMTTYEVTLNKARNAYIKYVLYSSLDRDEIQAEMLRSFDSDVVEEAIADVESELEELN